MGLAAAAIVIVFVLHIAIMAPHPFVAATTVVVLIDDFSDSNFSNPNALAQYRGGLHVQLQPHQLKITSPKGKWTEVVAENQAGRDLTGHGLQLTYSMGSTGQLANVAISNSTRDRDNNEENNDVGNDYHDEGITLVIDFHQRNTVGRHDHTNKGLTTTSSYTLRIDWPQRTNTVVVPISKFPDANPMEGYAFTIRGQVNLYQIALVLHPADSQGEAEVWVDDKVAGERTQVEVSEGEKPREEKHQVEEEEPSEVNEVENRMRPLDDDHYRSSWLRTFLGNPRKAAGHPFIHPEHFVPDPQVSPPPKPKKDDMGNHLSCGWPGMIAMTYDDGPHPSFTDRILTTAKEFGYQLTFFWVGDRLKESPLAAWNAVQAGHVLASHTLSHRDLTQLDDRQLHEQVAGNEEVLKPFLKGQRPVFFRPPYGSMDQRVYDILTKQYKYIIIMWSLDSHDWDTKHQTVSRIMEHYTNMMDESDPNQHSHIALNHDMYMFSLGAPLAPKVFSLIEKHQFKQVPLHICLNERPYQL